MSNPPACAQMKSSLARRNVYFLILRGFSTINATGRESFEYLEWEPSTLEARVVPTHSTTNSNSFKQKFSELGRVLRGVVVFVCKCLIFPFKEFSWPETVKLSFLSINLASIALERLKKVNLTPAEAFAARNRVNFIQS